MTLNEMLQVCRGQWTGRMEILEKEPLNRLSAEGQLMSFYHGGFWQCMDTQREKQKLEALWASGNAPWKRW